MRGIIYKYTSPSNKVYIGQTINEPNRRRTFNNINLCYAGGKIDNARLKYGPENFKYEILEEIFSDDVEFLILQLNLLEIQHIKAYNSVKEGYNIDSGGHSYRVYDSKSVGERISKAKSKKVIQYDLSGCFILIWESSKKIEESLGINSVGIRNCCRDKTTHAECYIWRYYLENFDYKIQGLSEAKQNQIYALKQSLNTKEGRTFKKVILYDIYGKFIKIFESITEAAEQFNILLNNISINCIKQKGCCRGYIWRYYTENFPKDLHLSKAEINQNIINTNREFNKVLLYDINNTLIDIFDSFTHAEKSTGIPRKLISKACNTGKLLKDCTWKYHVY